MNRRIGVLLLATLVPQMWGPVSNAQSRDQLPGAVAEQKTAKKPPAGQVTAAAAPQATKSSSPMAQRFVERGAKNPGTACGTARVDKNGQLDCGTHVRSARSDRGRERGN
jgi:hypothetical protein